VRFNALVWPLTIIINSLTGHKPVTGEGVFTGLPVGEIIDEDFVQELRSGGVCRVNICEVFVLKDAVYLELESKQPEGRVRGVKYPSMGDVKRVSRWKSLGSTDKYIQSFANPFFTTGRNGSRHHQEG